MDVIFNSTEIENILIDFHTITKLHLAIHDSNGKLICRYPTEFPPICAALQESHEGKLRCDECDRLGIENARAKMDVVIYHCHAGLTEICMPIVNLVDTDIDSINVLEKQILGFLVIGHLIEENENKELAWQKICKNCSAILPSISSMYNQFATVKPVSQNYINSLCNTLRIMVRYIALSRIYSLQKNPLWESIKKYINENLDKSLNVDEISYMLSVSKSTLTRCSIANSGVSIKKYIINERMKRARHLLKNTDLPISIIAETCGIKDNNYFTRAFKSQYNTTPFKYRKMSRLIK